MVVIHDRILLALCSQWPRKFCAFPNDATTNGRRIPRVLKSIWERNIVTRFNPSKTFTLKLFRSIKLRESPALAAKDLFNRFSGLLQNKKVQNSLTFLWRIFFLTFINFPFRYRNYLTRRRKIMIIQKKIVFLNLYSTLLLTTADLITQNARKEEKYRNFSQKYGNNRETNSFE